MQVLDDVGRRRRRRSCSRQGWPSAQDNARGIAVYGEQKCSLCHSIGGKGNPKGPLDDVGSKLSADDIKAWITNPKEMAEKSKSERKPPMKAYPNLPAADHDGARRLPAVAEEVTPVNRGRDEFQSAWQSTHAIANVPCTEGVQFR